MAKKIEVWYSANNDFWRSEPVYEEAPWNASVRTGYDEKVKTGFSPIHTFYSPVDVYNHFLEATDLANGGMCYTFWQVAQNQPREKWERRSFTMDEFRKAKNTMKLIKDQWK